MFVYEKDTTDPVKHATANEWLTYLWSARRGRTSFQVLQEFYAIITQKMRPGLPRPEAREAVLRLLAWHPTTINAELLEAAFALQDRYPLSFWDSLIVASAQNSACSHLLTEDLQDGRELDGVVVVNPFLHAPDSI